MKSLLQDLGYALRQLRKAPGFSVTAILTLALSIGVATAVFSVIDAVIVRPLPFADPDSIVFVQPYSSQGYSQPDSYPQYLDYRRENHSFLAYAGYSSGTMNFEGPQGPAPIRAVSTTDNFFQVFGVNPYLGRTFLPGEDQPGRNDVVVISYEVWQQNFGGRNDVVGSTVKLDGSVYTVIGVMPAGFRYPLASVNAIYRPLHLDPLLIKSRGSHWLPTVARLKKGVTLQQARMDLARVLDDLGRINPDEKGERMVLTPLAKKILGKTSEPLQVLILAVLGLLAIGCVNIAGLLLAHGIKRERELALRSAIGATRSRIVRQLLTETVVLAVVGAFGGGVLAEGLLIAIKKLLISALARGADVRLNLTVLSVALFLAVVTGLVAGILPSFHLSSIAPGSILRSGGRAGSSRHQNRIRSGFIVIQVSLTLVLLVCSGLLLRTLQSLRNTDLGFSPDRILAEEIDLSPVSYEHKDLMTSYYRPLLQKVESIPGVDAAGLIQVVPIQDSGWNGDVQIVGQAPAPPNVERIAEIRIVTEGIYKSFGIELLKGRLLDPKIDTPSGQQVCVVNEAFVKKFFSPGEDPVGRVIDRGEKLRIVGVTRNIRQDLMHPPLAEMDFPAWQLPAKEANLDLISMRLVIHSSVGSAAIIDPLKKAMQDIDPTVPFRPAETMHEIIADTLILDRLESWLFGIFAVLALLLSVVGIYGLISHEVELHTRDIGIQMALGSTRGNVLTSILRKVSVLMLAGVAVGWTLALGIQKILATVVEINLRHDFVLLLAITSALAGIGLLASLFPAQKAASIEPMEALRTD